jgi:predicted nucleotidyltransferase
MCKVRDVNFRHPVESVIPGAQGRLLAVLASTTAELSLRTMARLAGVSIAQASRVLPNLVEQGFVERREVPPSAQYRLNVRHLVSQFIVQLSASRTVALAEMRLICGSTSVTPASVIVFGSFARGEADEGSDIDLVVVRPKDVDEADAGWADTVQQITSRVTAFTGNAAEVLELSEAEIASRLRSTSALWVDIRDQGIVVFGASISEFADRSAARA